MLTEYQEAVLEVLLLSGKYFAKQILRLFISIIKNNGFGRANQTTVIEKR